MVLLLGLAHLEFSLDTEFLGASSLARDIKLRMPQMMIWESDCMRISWAVKGESPDLFTASPKVWGKCRKGWDFRETTRML